MPSSVPITSLNTARVLAGVLLFTTIGYGVVGTVLLLLGVLPKEGFADLTAETVTLVNSVFTVAGLVAVVSSLPLRKVLDGSAPRGEAGLPVRFRNMVIGMALSEGAGAFGFVTALLTGSLSIPMILWGAAIAGCVLHFPTQRLIDDATNSIR